MVYFTLFKNYTKFFLKNYTKKTKINGTSDKISPGSFQQAGDHPLYLVYGYTKVNNFDKQRLLVAF